MWGLGSTARGLQVALGLVTLVVIFSALWVGIGAGIHTHYETPTPVCCFTLPLSDSILITDVISFTSSGVGSAPNIQANAWEVNTSGSGWHYLPRYCTSLLSSGSAVACLSMKKSGTS
jgi:hypothetical protein